METKKLEVFEKIVELSSLTKAAEELGMSERTLYRKLPPEYRKK